MVVPKRQQRLSRQAEDYSQGDLDYPCGVPRLANGRSALGLKLSQRTLHPRQIVVVGIVAHPLRVHPIESGSVQPQDFLLRPRSLSEDSFLETKTATQ